MKTILRVAKKEFLDMFRDKRSLMRMMLIPLLAFPLILYIVTTIQSSESKKTAEKELKVGYVVENGGESFIEFLENDKNIVFVEYPDTIEMRANVENEEISAGIRFKGNMDDIVNSQISFPVYITFRGADMEEYSRVEDLLEAIADSIIAKRLEVNNLAPGFVKPIDLDHKENISSMSEILGKYAGGLLPYIFIAFCFMGCMYPAIDLFAGEKERGTMETLLIAPVNRVHILIGKMIVITSFGLISAFLALAGLFLSLNLIEMNGDLLTAVNQIISPSLIATLMILLIPLAIFFTGIMTPLSIYAKSYKEAQSTMVPLNIVMVLPAIAGFIPSVELDYTTAFIPIVNIVLATKQIIAGNVDWIPVGISFVSLVLIAAIAVVVSHKQFGKESNILRGD